ncbi:retron St85 family effector protein [Glacieibacterium sp.]|uniref:retron St85 family effector protein n=1 Tax=Glacieibacterium sp. TaxID=2860237 RepID=UPI003AFF9784
MEDLHVQAPTEIIFLCGGPYTDVSTPGTASMRDAFLKINSHPALGRREIVLAEDFTTLTTFSAHYGDILEFETDLAQITELILLFCESAGSFAELGSFASTLEIASKLLVIVRDHYWKDNSFIKLGPLMFLLRKHDSSVFVIDDAEVSIIPGIGITVDLDKFKTIIDEPLRKRLTVAREPSTFDNTRAGHVIKLIVGLVQEYGALERSEITEVLSVFGVPADNQRLGAYILCATSVGWIQEQKKGFRDFIVSTVDQPAIHFVANAKALTKNRVRRRLLIREHWEKNDPSRFRVISSAAVLTDD